jgi:hypothetical protein
MGPSNHRLRVEALFDQSQGYEPCGLNLDRLLLYGRIYPTPLRSLGVFKGGFLLFYREKTAVPK